MGYIKEREDGALGVNMARAQLIVGVVYEQEQGYVKGTRTSAF